MSRYRPGLDDDRLVGAALEALAQDTDGMEAPPAVEARLRAAFRAPAERTIAPVAPKRPRAWKWVATVGAAAGLIWLAYAFLRTGPQRRELRESARTESPAPSMAPRDVVAVPAAPSVAPAAPRTVRVAATDAPRAARRRARAEPAVERFEPLYPGDPLADLDAVHLVRVSVPRSALATLGWPARPGARERVELDAMVGPDGMTRAVRFVSQ